MRILAFAGSNSKHSINKQLVSYVLGYFDEFEIDFLDLNDFEMPLYSIDREKANGIPTLAQEFASKINAADLILMSLAEHNGSYTVAFKNIYDWVSRIQSRKVLGGKPIFLMSTSPGGRGGLNVLNAAQTRFPFDGGELITTFSLPFFKKNFHPETGVLDEELAKLLQEAIEVVKEYLELNSPSHS